MRATRTSKFVKNLSLLIALPIFLHAGAAYSAAILSAHVVNIGTYGNGNITITFDATITEPTCPAARVDIPSTHPLIKSFLAMAMMAKSSGSILKVATTGCYDFPFRGSNYSFPTIDQTNDGEMTIKP